MAGVPLELVLGRAAVGVDPHGDGPPHLPAVALDEDEVPHAVVIVGVRGAPGLLFSNVVRFHDSNFYISNLGLGLITTDTIIVNLKWHPWSLARLIFFA